MKSLQPKKNAKYEYMRAEYERWIIDNFGKWEIIPDESVLVRWLLEWVIEYVQLRGAEKLLSVFCSDLH